MTINQKNKKRLLIFGVGVMTLALIVIAVFISFRNLQNDKQESFANFAQVTDPELGLINLQTVEISLNDLNQPLALYFPYGPVRADAEILNANSRATIDDPRLTFVQNTLQDRYFGDPAAGDDGDQPQGVQCFEYFQATDDYTGPTYQIDQGLVASDSFTYGLQSARNPNVPSGLSTVDRLEYAHNGCLSVFVQFDNAGNFQEGDVIQVIFDEDIDNSPSYPAGDQPYPVVYRFVITAQNLSSSDGSSVSSTNGESSSSDATSSDTSSSDGIGSSSDAGNSSSDATSSDQSSLPNNSSSSISSQTSSDGIGSSSSSDISSSSVTSQSSSTPDFSSSSISSSITSQSSSSELISSSSSLDNSSSSDTQLSSSSVESSNSSDTPIVAEKTVNVGNGTNVENGEILTYTIAVRNNTNELQFVDGVTDNLDEDLEFIDCTNDCEITNGDTVFWNINRNLNPQEIIQVSFRARVVGQDGAAITNTASVDGRDIVIQSNPTDNPIGDNPPNSNNSSNPNNTNSSSSAFLNIPPNAFTNTIRSGGPGIVAIILIIGGGAACYIVYKSRRKKLNKVDITNDSLDKKDISK
jgi:hypothetical protein